MASYQPVVVIPIMGALANFLLLIYLFKHRVGSRTSCMLLRLQSTIDFFICIFAVVDILQPPFWMTEIAGFNAFLCYFWHSQFIYWYLVNSSIFVLVLTVIDRFAFIVFPFHYKKRKAYHLGIPLIVVLVLGIPHIGAMFAETGFVDESGVCAPSFEYYTSLQPWVAYLRKIFAVNWFMFDYILPAISIIVMYSIVIKKLRDSRKMAGAEKGQLSKRFTIATMIVAAIMCLSISFDATFYILLTYDVITINYFDPAYNKIGVIMSALNSSANPYVYMILMPSLRKFILGIINCKSCRQENSIEKTISSANENTIVVTQKDETNKAYEHDDEEFKTRF